jgi:ABC-type transport system involved in multi-copper enzyme maturation permease subunit
MIRLRVLKLLLKRDLRSVTDFPRLELIILPSLLVFVAVSQSAVFSMSWSLIVTVINNYKLAMTYPVIVIFIPIIVADILTNECESGVMLMLVSYPTKRSEILLSKFLSVFLVSWTVFFSVSLAGLLVAYRHYAMSPPMMFVWALLVSTGIMSFLVCSTATLISSIARRTVIAAMGSLTMLLLWPIIVDALSWTLKLPNLMILSYTAAVPELVEFWTLKWGQPGVQMSSIALVVAQLFLASFLLLLSHIAFNRKEFK